MDLLMVVCLFATEKSPRQPPPEQCYVTNTRVLPNTYSISMNEYNASDYFCNFTGFFIIKYINAYIYSLIDYIKELYTYLCFIFLLRALICASPPQLREKSRFSSSKLSQATICLTV